MLPVAVSEEPVHWECGRRRFDFFRDRGGVIMGILNVTPDSFSDGGRFFSKDAAVAHGLRMVEQGAAIIDIGGESTRPGAAPVDAEEELRRVLPVLRALRQKTDALISIDTSKAFVARECLASGADIINDVTALTGDPEMLRLLASARCGVVLMHMRGTPRTMQIAPHYTDVVREVRDFLLQRMRAAVENGIEQERIVLDPGIGFGKTFEHNRALLAATATFAGLGRPLLIGVSRKSFLGAAGAAPQPAERLWPGVAITAFCRERGASIFRVHDVAENMHALRMTEALLAESSTHA